MQPALLSEAGTTGLHSPYIPSSRRRYLRTFVLFTFATCTPGTFAFPLRTLWWPPPWTLDTVAAPEPPGKVGRP